MMMVSISGSRRSSGRGVIALLAAFLLLLISLAPHEASSDLAQYGSVLSAADCAAAPPGPGPIKHSHCSHCVPCAEIAVDAPFRIATIVVTPAPAAPPAAPDDQAWREDAPILFYGWSSSWSSQAPPSFS